MAIIGKIRKHSTLLLIAVGGALVLFVLSDLLSGGAGTRQKSIPELANVFGEKISFEDWNTRLEQQLSLYKMQYGENITAPMAFQIREEVFNEMIRQAVLQHQYKKIGLRISKAELFDMLTGTTLHPFIRQNFTDPQTGVFNPQYVISYLENLETLNADQQQQWMALERIIKEERYHDKYIALIKKSFFIPRALLLDLTERQNLIADILLLQVKYTTISDEEIELSDEDYKNYYEKHKNEYEQEETRHINYIIFDIVPSANDYEEGLKRYEQLASEFLAIDVSNIKENYNFVLLHSDLDYKPDTGFLKRFVLPAEIDSLFDMPKGSVASFNQNMTFYKAKLLDRQVRADSLKAMHLLISFRGAFRASTDVKRTKEEAKKLADSLIMVIHQSDSAQFAELAKKYSNDPSAKNNGGYLGWFEDGRMIHEFNEACMKANIGSTFIVESAYGYHIVRLMDKRNIAPKVRIAILKYTIEPSNSTRQEYYIKASKFASDIQSIQQFDKLAEDMGYVVRTSEYARKSDYSLPGIIDGREIIRWAFEKDTQEGQLSSIYELDAENKIVVAIIRKIRNEGVAPLEQVKEIIHPFVLKEKKADILYKQVEEIHKKSKSLEEIARHFSITIDTIEAVSFSSVNIPWVGPEPRVVGTIFGTPKEQITPIIKGEGGIFIALVTDIKNNNEIPEDVVYSYQNSFIQNRVTFDVYNALKKAAKVKENKTFYY